MFRQSAKDVSAITYLQKEIKRYEEIGVIENQYKRTIDSLNLLRLREDNLHDIQLENYKKVLNSCADRMDLGHMEVKEIQTKLRTSSRKLKFQKILNRIRTVIEVAAGGVALYYINKN